MLHTGWKRCLAERGGGFVRCQQNNNYNNRIE